MTKLTFVRPGETVIFQSAHGGRAALEKLTDMGLIRGGLLKVVHNAGRGPVTVLVKGAKLALGHGLADKIMVKEKR